MGDAADKNVFIILCGHSQAVVEQDAESDKQTKEKSQRNFHTISWGVIGGDFVL
jgi:hypothetical protein